MPDPWSPDRVDVVALPLPPGASRNDTLLAVLEAVDALEGSLGTVGDLEAAPTVIGRLKRLVALLEAEDFASQVTLESLRANVATQLDLTISSLRNAITGAGVAAKTLADVVAAVQATQTVSGTVNVGNLPDVQSVDWNEANPVQDDYQSGEVLADQVGAGAVLTFTFATPVNLVVVHARGENLTARANPFGGVPSASSGVVCGDDVPTYLPVVTATVRVFAPTGMTISVHGYRRL